MRIQDSLKLSTRMFKTNPARTWLTVLGMGVGISAVVTLVGLGFGLQNILLNQIVFGDTLLSLNVTNPPSRVIVLNNDSIDNLKKIPHVQDVAPLASFPASAAFGGLTANVTLEGIDPTYFRYAGIVAQNGKAFDAGDESNSPVLLSSAALKLFGVDDPKSIIGKTISFRVTLPNAPSGTAQEMDLQGPYNVIGVETNAAAIEAIVPLSNLRSQFEIAQYDKVQVRVDASGNLNSVQDAVLKQGFQVTALSKTVEQANQIFQGVQAVLAVFGGIALIVSSIGMFNTMTVTLLERTGEIGVMRTLGASPRNIKILFLTESVVVGFLGGLSGILIGVGSGSIINFALDLVAKHYGGVAVALFAFPIPFLVFIAVFSGFVGFLTGVFPARRAAKISPLEAIRYK